jgi:hypothetical protein
MRRHLIPLAALLLPGPLAAEGIDDRTRVGVIGDTLTNGLLRSDVLRIARMSVPALAKRASGDPKIGTCKQVDLVETVITDVGDEPPGKRAWAETWTFQVCDRRVAVPIRFEPAEIGGTYFTLSDNGTVVGDPPPRRNRSSD